MISGVTFLDLKATQLALFAVIDTMSIGYERSEQTRRHLPLALINKIHRAADDNVSRAVLKRSSTAQTDNSEDSLEDLVEIRPEPTASRKKKKKSVSFSVVEIRRYPVTLGDNPSCNNGPPIQIDWEYIELPSIPLNASELFHRERSRGGSPVSTISAKERLDILRVDAGFSSMKIILAVSEVERIRRNRRESMNITAAERSKKVWSQMIRKARRQLSRGPASIK